MKLPVHLNALRAFEASARHQSFALAAQELSVTPAAVGQLVRSLEDWLGAPLFHRSPTGRARLVPTALAEHALPDIRAGFDRLGLGMAKLKEGSVHGALTITVSPAFAAKWLLPRIDRYQAMYPDTDVRLDTNLKLVDFAAQGIDIGVRYGRGTWPGLVSEKLMEEEVYPVCSPSFAKEHRLRAPADLARHTLIHDHSVDSHAGFVTWHAWLAHAGLPEAHVERGMQINNSAAVLQAAMDGHGVALGRSVMARDDIAAGRLVRLFPKIAYPSALAYYVVYREGTVDLPRIATFKAWALSEAAAASQ